MLADPIVLNLHVDTITNTVIDGVVGEDIGFNLKPSTVPGRTVRSVSPAALASGDFSKLSLTIQHTTTNQGRVRSLVRTDAASPDAALAERTASVQLVIDREDSGNDSARDAVACALRTLITFLVADGTTGLALSTRVEELLNGEA